VARSSATPRRARVRAAATRRAATDSAPAFLEAFLEHGLIVAACRIAGVSRATVWRRRQADEDFALAFHDADQDVLAALEDEALRRALHGVERPVSVAGQRELVRHYSDTLLAMLLRARAPERYVDRARLEYAGHVEHEHTYDPGALLLVVQGDSVCLGAPALSMRLSIRKMSFGFAIARGPWGSRRHRSSQAAARTRGVRQASPGTPAKARISVATEAAAPITPMTVTQPHGSAADEALSAFRSCATGWSAAVVCSK
jgi:hypothetical protein